jgi:hypothetical protein
MVNRKGKKLRTRYRFYHVSVGRAACAAVLIMVCGALAGAFAADVPEWLDEFEDICSQTMDAQSLSDEELQSLVERCEKLLPIIEQSTFSKKKVYLFRIKKCRDLFEFVLEVNQRG